MKRVISMDIYERINALLAQKKMTRRNLCAAAGLSYSTMSSLFQRRSKNMRLETIRAIARALDVTADYLVLGRDPKPETIAEAAGPAYNAGFEQTEVDRILAILSKRGRTIVLAKAYEQLEREEAERRAGKPANPPAEDAKPPRDNR